jgi:integrase
MDVVAKALARFEKYTSYRSFKNFRHEQAVGFKRHLTEQLSEHAGKPLAKATLKATLHALRSFFVWLAGQQGYRSHLSYSEAKYFSLSDKDARVASAHRERSGPTMEQIAYVLQMMAAHSEIERRNRAIIAFAILTGARDGAIASFNLKHIDIVEDLVEQDARDVNTKGSKTFTTWFFPVGDQIRQIVVDWVGFLRKEKLWGPDDPLFPATRVGHNADRRFVAAGIDRKQWSSAETIRKVFKDAFEQAGLPYFHPHSFRKTLVQRAFDLNLTAEQLKAWSQNLGHEAVMTTFTNYGTVMRQRQADIMRELRRPQKPAAAVDDLCRQLVEAVRQKSVA